MSKFVYSIVTFSIVAYLSILAFMFFFQRTFMYHPSAKNYSPEKITFQYEEVFIPSSDNIGLKSWFSFDLPSKKTILFFHGNAGELDARIYKLNILKDLGLNFLIISYRGYSGNKGKPSEKGFYEDAQSAVKWLENKGIKKENIILYGESIGTGVATETASRDKYAGVILESPFTSLVDMGKKLYPFLPVSILQKDRYENDKKIKLIQYPILIMHGKADTIVPFDMGKKLYDKAQEPKFNFFPEDDNHMMAFNEDMKIALSSFFAYLSKQ